MRIGSLFAGIGGFDLAARWMGWETAWVSEIDPYASAVLKKHWPNAPNLGDITKITRPPTVDILCGGFPCQDISLAGKGEGIGGARSGLWKHYARLIEEIRPKYVVAENVSALKSRGLDVVLQDLMALGYDAEWHCIPAAYVGAPHRRDRIWIIATPADAASVYRPPFLGGEPYGDHAGTGEVADTNVTGLEGRFGQGVRECAGQLTARTSSPCRTAPDVSDTHNEGEPGSAINDGEGSGLSESAGGHGWWSVEPDVGRVAHGVPRRVDRLRCLGNAIVPQVAYTVFQAIEQYERGL